VAWPRGRACGAALGDDPLFPSRRVSRTGQGVVQLVGAGVVEILALEVEAGYDRVADRPPLRPRRQARAPEPAPRPPAGRLGRWAWAGRRSGTAAHATRPRNRGSWRVSAHARSSSSSAATSVLGHVATTEVAVEAPLAVLVGLQQRLRDGRRPSLDMRPIEARRAGPLDEESDAKAILPRPRGCERPLSDGTAATGAAPRNAAAPRRRPRRRHCRHVQPPLAPRSKDRARLRGSPAARAPPSRPRGRPPCARCPRRTGLRRYREGAARRRLRGTPCRPRSRSRPLSRRPQGPPPRRPTW